MHPGIGRARPGAMMMPCLPANPGVGLFPFLDDDGEEGAQEEEERLKCARCSEGGSVLGKRIPRGKPSSEGMPSILRRREFHMSDRSSRQSVKKYGVKGKLKMR